MTHPQTLDDYLASLRADFATFVRETWKFTKGSVVAPVGWTDDNGVWHDGVELDICRYAQHGPDLCGILAPRGIGKTHFISVMMALWEVFRDHDQKVLIVSASGSHAAEVTDHCRNVIKSVPYLRMLKPVEGKKDTGKAFQIAGATDSKQPSIKALGIDGQLEGNRAHLIIADDIELDVNTVTLASRDKLYKRSDEFRHILFKPDPSKPLSRRRVVMPGTYHHEDSVYLRLSRDGWDFRTWPVAYPAPNEKVLNLAPELAAAIADGRAKPGDSVFSHRIGLDYIEKERGRGRLGFLRQQMLICDLGTSLHYPLKLGDLIVMDVDPVLAPTHVSYGTQDHTGSTAIEDIPTLGRGDERLYRPAMMTKDKAAYHATYAYIDPSGAGADETAVSVIGHLCAQYHLKALVGLAGGMGEEALDAIVAVLKRTRATWARYESNVDAFDAFGPALEIAIRRATVQPGKDPQYPGGWSCKLEPIHSSGQKELRIIQVVEPIVSTHRLVVDKSVVIPDSKPIEYQFQRQFSHLTKDRKCLVHDDRMDALAGNLAMFLNTMDTAPAEASRRHRERIDELAEYEKKLGHWRGPREYNYNR